MEIFAKKEDPVETRYTETVWKGEKKQEERKILIQINFLVVNNKSDSLLTRLTELIVSAAEMVLNFLLNHIYGPSHLSEKVNEQLGEIWLADPLTNVLVPAFDIQHLKLITFSSHQVINFLHDQTLVFILLIFVFSIA